MWEALYTHKYHHPVVVRSEGKPNKRRRFQVPGGEEVSFTAKIVRRLRVKVPLVECNGHRTHTEEAGPEDPITALEFELATTEVEL